MPTRLEPPQTGRIKTPLEAPVEKAIAPFVEFVRAQTAGGATLILAAALAIVLATSGMLPLYESVKEVSIGVHVGDVAYAMPLVDWVNEGLMALFFFLLGLEIKRELMVGELRDPRRSLTMIAAALGGMLLPGLLYAAVVGGTPYTMGWGIPIATDTAFALAVLILLRRYVSAALRALLVGMAIADDLGAIAVVAIFYTASLNPTALYLAAAFFVIGAICNLAGARNPLIYVAIGIAVWGALLDSGIHGTVAGLLMAIIAPTTPVVKQSKFVELVRDRLRRFRAAHRSEAPIMEREAQQSSAEDIRAAAMMVTAPLRRWEQRLDTPVSLVILPAFAFLNAGIHLEWGRLAEFFQHPVFLGVAMGLLLGKPIGIWLATFTVVRLGLSELPEGVDFRQLGGMALLAGIGFTMSVFISGLAFPEHSHALDAAKAAIIGSSMVAAVLALIWFRLFCRSSASAP